MANRYVETRVNPSNIRQVDLVVGIPSYNEADSIGFVTKQVSVGLKKYFPSLTSVVIDADNHSLDRTKEVFLGCKTAIPKIYLSTPEGMIGKGNNLRSLFREMMDLSAKALVTIDADLKSITPEWIEKMIIPIVQQNYDYVTPGYARHRYDATITNQICYPLIYGLVGKDIRQPIGGDFACSREVVRYFLTKKWSENVRLYGIDIFMTTNAILGDFKLCQVPLGAKIHKPSAPKLGPMFSQITEVLFRNILAGKQKWKRIKKVEKPPIIGEDTLHFPQGPHVTYANLETTSTQGSKQKRQILARTLTPKAYKQLADMYVRTEIAIDRNLWAMIVYDCLFSYGKDFDFHCVEALKSLYFGRVASFMKESLDLSPEETESKIIKQAQHFFRTRCYFWDKYGGDRE